MSFRARLFAAFGLIAVIPLIGLAIGVRRELDQRLTAQYRSRVAALAAVTRTDLARTSAMVGDRLASLRDALPDDERLRAALRDPGERGYLLDYAGQAMRMTGLDMLQIQDERGRIVSSGHFRNEYDRLDPTLPHLLIGGAALVEARTPDGPRLVLARTDTARIGDRRLALVGGLAVDSTFLARLRTDSSLTVALVLPTDRSAVTLVLPSDLVSAIPFPFIANDSLARAEFVISHPTTDLDALRASVDRWFIAAVALVGLAATIGAIVLASRVSRPLATLAADTERLDLDRLDVNFTTTRTDEIGTLTRVLGALVRRLRSSAVKLREAERRATIGDLARQVTHDIKNGLAPIRHVLRHLDQVTPADLPTVFAERRTTLDASVAYLDALAHNYARLTTRSQVRAIDLNGLARGVVVPDTVKLVLQLDPAAPSINADPVVVRRIMDNLVSNAVDAGGNTVTIATSGSRMTIEDNGCGMTDEQLARAFDDFYTTKAHGTGLGLSIVRRLVADLGASLAVDTAPGRGTRMQITFS